MPLHSLSRNRALMKEKHEKPGNPTLPKPAPRLGAALSNFWKRNQTNSQGSATTKTEDLSLAAELSFHEIVATASIDAVGLMRDGVNSIIGSYNKSSNNSNNNNYDNSTCHCSNNNEAKIFWEKDPLPGMTITLDKPSDISTLGASCRSVDGSFDRTIQTLEPGLVDALQCNKPRVHFRSYTEQELDETLEEIIFEHPVPVKPSKPACSALVLDLVQSVGRECTPTSSKSKEQKQQVTAACTSQPDLRLKYLPYSVVVQDEEEEEEEEEPPHHKSTISPHMRTMFAMPLDEQGWMEESFEVTVETSFAFTDESLEQGYDWEEDEQDDEDKLDVSWEMPLTSLFCDAFLVGFHIYD